MDRETRLILIVDDSASTLFYLSMLLKRLEYKVEVARSIEEAVQKAEAQVPAVIVSEALFPGENAEVLLMRLKENESTSQVPVVILTASTDPGVKEACVSRGCAGYLQKPVEPGLLYRTLQVVSESIPRANIRLKTSVRVIVGDNSTMGGTERSEQAIALSEGGMYVKTSYPQPQKTLTPVRLFLADDVVTAKAEVLYNCTIPTGPYAEAGMGMRFVEISDSDRAKIRRFIKEALTSDLPE